MVMLRTMVRLRGEGMTTRGRFTVRKGETVSFTLTNFRRWKRRQRCFRWRGR